MINGLVNKTPTEAQVKYGGKDPKLLRRFLKEFFDYPTLRKAGFFTKEMRHDYYAQAERLCVFFGFESVFEYASKEIRCHITFGDPSNPLGIGTYRPNNEPFISVMKSIYE